MILHTITKSNVYLYEKIPSYWYCFISLIDINVLYWSVQSFDLSSALNRPGNATVCFLSPPVMGKSLLHRVSPCQKYLSAAIIWHQEKVEGDSGCKVALFGCTLKHGPTHLHSVEVWLVFLKEKLLTLARLFCGWCFFALFDYLSPCLRRPQQTVEQPSISLSQLDDLLLWSHVYFYKWWSHGHI